MFGIKVKENEKRKLTSETIKYFESKGFYFNWELSGHKVKHPEVGQKLIIDHTIKGQKILKTLKKDVVILTSYDTVEISNFNRHFKRQLKLNNKQPVTATYLRNLSYGEGFIINELFIPLNALSVNMSLKVVKLGRSRFPLYTDELEEVTCISGEII